MIKKILLSTAGAASVLLAPGVAAAGTGGGESPAVPYCGPGMTYVGINGGSGGCARTVLPPDPRDDGGIWSMLGTAFFFGSLFL